VNLTDDATLGVNYNETINGLSGDCSTTVCISSGSTLLTDGYSGSCNYNYSGTIMGSGALEIGEGAYQILTGSNTYSGGTTIDCMATLQLGDGGSSGSIEGNVFDNGTLMFDVSSCTTFCGQICGTGGVTVESGTVTFMGSNSYSGTTSVNNARLQDGASASFSPNSAVSLSNGAALGVGYNETINGLSGDCSTTVCITSGSTLLTNGYNGSCQYTYAGTISGCGGLAIGEGAFQILTSSNTYSGGTTIDCMATLQIGNDGDTGSITGDVVNNGQLAFDVASCTVFCGAICGTGSVAIGEGTVTLAGDNTYSGGTSLGAGTTLYVTNSNSLGIGNLNTNSLECSPSVLAASGGCVTIANNIVVGGSGLTLNFSGSPKLTLTGTISDAVSYDSLTINGPVDLEGDNTYSGGTTVNSACVTIGTSTGLGTGALTATGSSLTFTCNSSPTLDCATIQGDSVATFNGTSAFLRDLTLAESTLNFNGSCATIDNMLSDSSCSDNTINISGETQLTFNVSCDNQTTYHGLITDNETGTGTLVVTGAGVLELKGANSYGGGTTVNGGLLVAGNCSAFGTGPVTVNGAAALGVDTSVSVTNQVTVNTGGSLGGFGTFNPASADCIAIQGGSVVVGGAGSLSAIGGTPSNVVGTLSFGTNASLVLGGGGVMQFSIMNAGGSPGTDFSQIEATGSTVNVTASSVDPFTIQLVGVDSTGQIVGTANTFNPTLAYTWTLLSAGTITNFASNAFVIDSSTFFSNPTNGGIFSVSDVGNDLTLNFTPVPEPSTWALMASGLFAAFGAAVRRRRRS
jgi:fibronectin-binding autotransporter adhesin